MSKKKNIKTEADSHKPDEQKEKKHKQKEHENTSEQNVEHKEKVHEKKEHKQKIEELEKKVQELEDSLLRKVAEFENYKRRTENDQLNLLKYAAESFIVKILPIYDDLGRSLNHIDDGNQDSLKEGLKLVYDKFTKTLDEQGVKKLETKGKEFDVEFHEALMQQPSKDVPANTVVEEIEPGYIYKDKVIRHAKVIVSQEMDDVETEESKNENEG